MKKKLIAAAILFSGVVAVEMLLRIQWGFCDSPLAESNNRYEYIYQANQQHRRFGNRVCYNSQNMRSDEVNPKAVRVLGLGDSVINGGVQTEQDSLATSILSRSLTEDTNLEVQVLNISAGSWGPDNCAAYLHERGAFEATLLVLVVSSHDAYDNMDFEPVVGHHPSYPVRQYFLAVGELWDRYIWPRYIGPRLFGTRKEKSQAELEIRKSGKTFNPGFQQLLGFAHEQRIPLVIYLHPEQAEVKRQSYNEQGQEIIAFARENNIPLIPELDYGIDSTWFRDGIHPNHKGQRKMAEIMAQTIRPYLLKPE